MLARELPVSAASWLLMCPSAVSDSPLHHTNSLSGAFHEPTTPYLVSHASAIRPDELEMRCKITTPRKS